MSEKTLFNDYEAWTEDACELASKAHIALKPIIREFLDKGYTVREIGHVLLHEIISSECEAVLSFAMEKRRHERARTKD